MNNLDLSSVILEKAHEFGASCAGIANLRELKKAPAFVMMPQRPHMDRVGAVLNQTGLPEGEVLWREGMRSALVIAVSHPEDEQVLDWWVDGKAPAGNRKLIQILDKLCAFLHEAYPQVRTFPLPYHVEKGGIWLKDAAAAAGLGVVGKNNLLITPQYGPRIRLRAMLLSEDLPSSGPLAWDPCQGCRMPCRAACPQNAFQAQVYRPDDYRGLEQLPGRDGGYDLRRCDVQMGEDISRKTHEVLDSANGEEVSVVRYCRRCEFACIVGASGHDGR